MGTKVIDIAKGLANDLTVLKGKSLERTACQYTLKDGLAVVCNKWIVSDLKKHCFSTANNKRVLNVLVSYFSDDLGMSNIVQHYVSLKLTTVNATTSVFKAVKQAFEDE